MTYQNKLDILRENLVEFERRISIADQQRSLTLSEIAALICEESEQSEISELAERYMSIAGKCTMQDRLLLCREIVSNKRISSDIRKMIAIGDSTNALAGTHGKIAFPKNKYNDAAFEIFASKINSAKAIYSPSINSACEAVADGSCEFCILPIENSLEGKLLSFYALLDRFELKICAACDIDSDGDSNIRYALVCRGCREPSERLLKGSFYVFEFFLLDSGEELLGDLLNAAKICSAELLSLDSRPVPYDAQSKKFLLSFRVTGAGALLFRSFLQMNYDGCTPVALYPDPQK